MKNDEEDIEIIEYFDCDCSSKEHLMIVEYYNDHDRFEWVSFNIQMSQYLPWYSRVWAGLKYIFGWQDHGCYWANTLIENKADAERMIKLLERL